MAASITSYLIVLLQFRLTEEDKGMVSESDNHALIGMRKDEDHLF